MPKGEFIPFTNKLGFRFRFFYEQSETKRDYSLQSLEEKTDSKLVK